VSIASLADEPYEAKLQRALRHPIGEVRERAATLLGEVAGPQVRPVLLDLVLQEADIYLAAAALRGLARLQQRHPGLLPVDWKAFISPEHPLLVRVAALEVLRSGGVN
jgi:HEAT repeat protein